MRGCGGMSKVAGGWGHGDKGEGVGTVDGGTTVAVVEGYGGRKEGKMKGFLKKTYLGC